MPQSQIRYRPWRRTRQYSADAVAAMVGEVFAGRSDFVVSQIHHGLGPLAKSGTAMFEVIINDGGVAVRFTICVTPGGMLCAPVQPTAMPADHDVNRMTLDALQRREIQPKKGGPVAPPRRRG